MTKVIDGWDVNNVPETVKKYVVATVVSHELWYYGSFDKLDKALTITNLDEDKVVLCNE